MDRELVHHEELVQNVDHIIPPDVRQEAREHFGRVSHRDVMDVAAAHSVSPRLRSML